MSAMVSNNIKKQILLVDDNQMMRELGREYLLLMGYGVVLAKNGREALHLAKKKVFDLILLDLQMPILNGFETIQELKKFNCDVTPIVAVTGKSSNEYKKKCISAGFKEVLVKPYQLSKYQDLINKFIK